MIYRHGYWALMACVCVMTATAGWAAPDVAPAVPDLNLPGESEPVVIEEAVPAKPIAQETPEPAAPATQPVPKKPRPSGKSVAKKTSKNKPANQVVPAQNPAEPVLAQAAVPEMAAPAPQEENVAKDFVPARETQEPAVEEEQKPTVAYLPQTDRDPTLSPTDLMIIRHREMERLRAIEAEKQRKLEAERQRLAELERLRQLELERMRDPSKEIRGKIRINGIIGQEVFIGSKVYTVGKTVLGAKIVRVQPDSVTFMYKGQKFIKKVQLK